MRPVKVARMEISGKLRLWEDPVARAGPEAMAVDEWLLETAVEPVLRVYRWLGDWASIGYFGEMNRAREAFPGVNCVRRWTGGGMVDHRADWTYTLVLPASEPLASARGAESYRRIHAALVTALDGGALGISLSGGDRETGHAHCFANPVSYDLVDAAGAKIAGAGQRRTRLGLLHQGSVALPCEAQRLAAALAADWQAVELMPDPDGLAHKVLTRYGLDAWTERR
jgi:lipoyl(octanoyl) transferase